MRVFNIQVDKGYSTKVGTPSLCPISSGFTPDVTTTVSSCIVSSLSLSSWWKMLALLSCSLFWTCHKCFELQRNSEPPRWWRHSTPTETMATSSSGWSVMWRQLWWRWLPQSHQGCTNRNSFCPFHRTGIGIVEHRVRFLRLIRSTVCLARKNTESIRSMNNHLNHHLNTEVIFFLEF